MPHVTEHTPKVSTRSVKPYACESSREKRQQDRRPDRQTDRRIVQNHFSRRFGGCTSQIRSYLEVDFLYDANTSIDMEVKIPSLGPIHGSLSLSLCLRFGFWRRKRKGEPKFADQQLKLNRGWGRRRKHSEFKLFSQCRRV